MLRKKFCNYLRNLTKESSNSKFDSIDHTIEHDHFGSEKNPIANARKLLQSVTAKFKVNYIVSLRFLGNIVAKILFAHVQKSKSERSGDWPVLKISFCFQPTHFLMLKALINGSNLHQSHSHSNLSPLKYKLSTSGRVGCLRPIRGYNCRTNYFVL